jgi:hypothetical protein
MIDTVLNLLFRCCRRRITRPITPVTKTGEPQGGTYVVCLECGKQFAYDFTEMKIGKAIDRSHNASVLPPKMPKPRKTKLGYALLAAVPAAVVIGAVLKGNNKRAAVQPTPVERDEPMRRDG